MIAVSSWPASRRQALAIGVLVAALLIAWFALISPAIGLVLAQSEWRQGATNELARYRALTAERVKIDAALLQLQGSDVWRKLYVANDPAVAASGLQGDLRSLLSTHGASVQLLQPLQPASGKKLTRIGVRVSATFTIDRLQQFLQALPSSAHAMRIADFTLTAPQFQIADENPVLTVTMDVHGFMRTPAEARP